MTDRLYDADAAIAMFQIRFDPSIPDHLARQLDDGFRLELGRWISEHGLAGLSEQAAHGIAVLSGIDPAGRRRNQGRAS